MAGSNRVGADSGTGQPVAAASAPTIADLAAQVALRCAFLLLRLWWFVRRPRQHGALLVLWCGDRALLLRNSYQPLWSAPGGGVRRGEAPADAAARETAEEVGLSVDPAALSPALDVEHAFRHRPDRVELFVLALPERPRIRIDNREVIAAAWVTRTEALRLDLLPHLRSYFEQAPD